MARDKLDNQSDKSDEQSGGEDSTNGPDEDLTADNNATEIHILLLLLLLGWAQQPALLCLIQLPRCKCSSIVVLQVSASLIVSCGICGVYLQWASPWISPVHTYLELGAINNGGRSLDNGGREREGEREREINNVRSVWIFVEESVGSERKGEGGVGRERQNTGGGLVGCL